MFRSILKNVTVMSDVFDCSLISVKQMSILSFYYIKRLNFILGFYYLCFMEYGLLRTHMRPQKSLELQTRIHP